MIQKHPKYINKIVFYLKKQNAINDHSRITNIEVPEGSAPKVGKPLIDILLDKEDHGIEYDFSRTFIEQFKGTDGPG